MRELETNMKMGRRETEWEGLKWIKISVDRKTKRSVTNKIMNFRVP
jgi:hypothetical protein